MHWSLTAPFTVAEFVAMAVIVSTAVLTPRPVRRALARVGRGLLRVRGRRPELAVFLLALAWNLLPLAFYEPVPFVHDEFSYLLMADTFLHGRLSMPTHPLWRSFETFHVIQEPTYASKYPPFQGLVLAAGMLLFGTPFLGVKIVAALDAAGVCWALRGWMPPRWAVLGAVVFALQFGGFSYWSQMLFGGVGATLGGALVLGAYPRLAARPRVRHGVLLGVGLAILATTRPYEGLFLAVPLAAALLRVARRSRDGFAVALVPAGLLAAVAVAGVAAYNRSVTGEALTFPYQVYTERYGYAPPFRFQAPHREVKITPPVMQKFVDEFERGHYHASGWERWRPLLRFYVVPLLPAPLLLLPGLWRHRRSRFPILLGAAALLASTLTTFLLPHYVAPFSALLLLLLVQCLRLLFITRWRDRRIGRPIGQALLRAWFYAWIAIGLVAGGAQAHAQGLHPWYVVRRDLERELNGQPGSHLVFVHYEEAHSPHAEWVYNRADIDAARVVWAREVGPAQDAALRRYYCGRTVWLVRPDGPGPIRPEKLHPPSCGSPG
jgi:hypothetical protein